MVTYWYPGSIHWDPYSSLTIEMNVVFNLHMPISRASSSPTQELSTIHLYLVAHGIPQRFRYHIRPHWTRTLLDPSVLRHPIMEFHWWHPLVRGFARHFSKTHSSLCLQTTDGLWPHTFQCHSSTVNFLAPSSVCMGYSTADVVKGQLLILSASISFRGAKSIGSFWLLEARYSALMTKAYLCSHSKIIPLWGLYKKKS